MANRITCIFTVAAMLVLALPALARAEQSANTQRQYKSETVVASWDFESDPADEGWTFVDEDGDGLNWEHSKTYTHNQSAGALTSYSWMNGNFYYDPDNWAITPAVTIPQGSTVLRYWGRNHMATGADVMRVYAGTSPNIADMQPIDRSTGFNIDLKYEEKVIDISALEGQTVYFAFRHYNSFEIGKQFFIDDIEVVNGVDIPAAPGGLLYGCYFDDIEELEGWQFADADGDGFGWKFRQHPYYACEGAGVIGSESFITDMNHGGPCAPDNWIISPPIQLQTYGNSLTFRATSVDEIYDMYYLDHFAVYAGTSPDIESMSMVFPETEVTNEFLLYTADLSEFANQTVYLAIRHYGCYGQAWLRVDNFEVWGSNTGPLGRIYGDVDLNGSVEITDTLLLMRYLIGCAELDEAQLDMAEVDGNADISIMDALLILRYAIGSLEVFPRETLEST